MQNNSVKRSDDNYYGGYNDDIDNILSRDTKYGVPLNKKVNDIY